MCFLRVLLQWVFGRLQFRYHTILFLYKGRYENISFKFSDFVVHTPAFLCKKDNPVIPIPPELPKAVSLSLVDVSCTEAFIKVNAADSVLPLNISLTKDDSSITYFILTKKDTVIVDTTLQPDQSYIYQTTEEINGIEEKSDTIRVKTLNVSSDNFTWQTFTFGDPAYGSSDLNDVAIIDENNIWAVGDIYNDTTGQAYNAVHWDGNQWELKKITINFRGNNVTPPLYGIFAFSSSDIWMVGSLPIHGDGQSWIIYDLRTTVDPNLSLAKVWEAEPTICILLETQEV